MQVLGGSGREPDALGSFPYGQAQLGGDLRASAGLGWASPSTSSSQALPQPPLSPGGIFVLIHSPISIFLFVLNISYTYLFSLPGLLVLLGPRTAIATAALPPLLLIPLPLSLQS